MKSKIGLITAREYMTRVSKKSFIITTILTPIFMLGLMVLPAVIMALGGTETKDVLVIDNTGKVFGRLESDNDLKFTSTDAPVDSLIAAGNFDALLVIPDSLLSPKATLKLYSNGPSSLTMEGSIKRQIDKVIEEERLMLYNIDNLDKILQDVHSDVAISMVRTDKADKEAESASAGLSYALGIALTFVLYMFMLMYGQMVMTSVIEEKNNRVLEIIVSSVKPTQLMMGKITGIGLVALTQMLLWIVLLTAMVAFVLPAVIPADAMAQVTAMQSGTLDVSQVDTEDLELIKAVAGLSNVGYIVGIFGWMLLFLVGGFFLYAALDAAIGSAVDNIQDAGQLQTVIVLPILVGLVCSMLAAAEPDSTIAFWLSMIPLTSPMVMMARIPAGIPVWEIVTSLAVLFVSVLGTVWVAAKVYRVGIFMYGKKPSLKELVKWIRY